MRKKLFIMSMSPILLTPILLVSCGQENVQARIDKAKKQIADIISSKPLPKLLTPIESNDVRIANYLDLDLFEAPVSTLKGFKIQLESIELPMQTDQDFAIWLKVISTDTTDIAPEIADYYVINFKELTEIKDKNVITFDTPEDLQILQTKFTNLIQQKFGYFTTLISDAVHGEGSFKGQGKITVTATEYIQLTDRLNTKKIDDVIFEGRQRNIYMNFLDIIVNPNNQRLSFNISLGTVPNSEIIHLESYEIKVGE